MTEANTARTKDAIRKAFLSLLDESSIEKISVAKVIELAHLSRTTFYRYYKDIYDLLNDCFVTYCRVDLHQVQSDELAVYLDEMHRVSVEGAKRVQTYRRLYLTCLDCGDYSFKSFFKGGILQEAVDIAVRTIELFGLTPETCMIPIPNLASMCVDIQVIIFKDWAARGCPETSEEIAHITCFSNQRFVESMRIAAE